MLDNYAGLKTLLARKAIIRAHQFSTFLHGVDVDLSSVEKSLTEKVNALTTKVDELQARLEAYDESVYE